MTKHNSSCYIKKCPIGCKSDLSFTDIHLSEGTLRICSNCGQLVSSLSRQCLYDSLNQLNVVEGTWPAPENLKSYHRLATKLLSPLICLLKKPVDHIRLLDVGCSSGAFIYAATKKGFLAEGVEPCEEPVKTATKKGLLVHKGYLEEICFPDKSFDVVLLMEVVEHLTDSVSLLKECHRILKGNGVVLIKTGNSDSWTAKYLKSKWDYFDISHGGHVSFFNPTSIKRLAANTGFEPVKFYTHSVGLYDKQSLPFIAYRSAKLFSELLNIFSRVYNKGHEMIVYLRKV